LARFEVPTRSRRWIARYGAALGFAIGTFGMPPEPRVRVPVAIERTEDRRASGDRFDRRERAGRGMILTLPLGTAAMDDAGSTFGPN